MFPFCRLGDWRQRPDIIIIAPKVVDVDNYKNNGGFSCPSAKNELLGLGLDWAGLGTEFKLQHNGELLVIFVKHRSKCSSPNQKKKLTDLWN